MTVPIEGIESVAAFDWHSIQELWPVPAFNVEQATAVEETALVVQLVAADVASSVDAGTAVNACTASDVATSSETTFVASSIGDTAAIIDAQALATIADDTAIAVDEISSLITVTAVDTASAMDADAYVSRNDPPTGYAIHKNFLTVHNNFEGGIAGHLGGPHIAAINSGDTAGSAFDTTKFTWLDTDLSWSFGLALYHDFEPQHGSICGGYMLWQTLNDDVPVDTYCAWNKSLGAHSELYTRQYVKTWTADLRSIDVAITEWTDSETGCATRLILSVVGELSLASYDADNVFLGGFSITTLNTEIWYRIEVHLRFSPIAGNGVDNAISEVYVYIGDNPVPLAVAAGLYPNSEVERCDQFRFGLFSPVHGGGVHVPAEPVSEYGFVGWVWMDDIAATGVDWIGPAEQVIFSVDSAVATDAHARVYATGTIEKTNSETLSAVDVGVAAKSCAGNDAASAVDFGYGAIERVVLVDEAATVDDFGVYERA